MLRYRQLAHDLLRSLTDEQIARLSKTLDDVQRGHLLAFCQNIAEDNLSVEPGSTSEPDDEGAVAASARALLAFRDSITGNESATQAIITSFGITQMLLLNEAFREATLISRIAIN